jgi:hypothetical protein
MALSNISFELLKLNLLDGFNVLFNSIDLKPFYFVDIYKCF